MAINFPGPYELRIFYTVAVSGGLTLTHSQRLNVALTADPDPGTAFGLITVNRGGASTDTLETVLNEWIALVRTIYNTSNTSFTLAELWKYEAQSFEASFVSAQDISLGGSAAGGNVVTGQAIFTFRSAEGGVLKVNFMESILASGNKLQYAALSADGKAIVDYIIAVDGPFLARDTSQPFAFIATYPGQNEALFKKRFRA